MYIMEKKSAPELNQKMYGISSTYFLIDLHNDRELFYALTYDEIVSTESWLCFSGIALNRIMDGDLKEAWNVINSIPEGNSEKTIILKFLKIGLTVVHPEITFRQFVDQLNTLKNLSQPLITVMLTAGRPFLLNGFNDFSRIGVLLPKHREQFLGYIKYMYDESLCPHIYNLCLAEYYYQINRLVDAEMLVGTSLKKFNAQGEQRITFAALYLQAKILLANGKTVKSESFVQDIRKLTGETGRVEFSYNIDAMEVLFFLYEGKMGQVSEWLKKGAPDEFADFNMLDLYRYMIKMRCYIATRKYAAVIALVERLRPLVIAGRRHMDLCELDLLLAMSLYSAKKENEAFEALDRALKIARRHDYLRLVADEAEPMLRILIPYIKQREETPFLMKLVEMTRDMAIHHPLYMKIPLEEGESFTQMELDVLTLMEHGKSKEEIAEYFFISVNTVKYHIKNIYAKLGAKSANQAVWNAKVLGVI